MRVVCCAVRGSSLAPFKEKLLRERARVFRRQAGGPNHVQLPVLTSVAAEHNRAPAKNRQTSIPHNGNVCAIAISLFTVRVASLMGVKSFCLCVLHDGAVPLIQRVFYSIVFFSLCTPNDERHVLSRVLLKHLAFYCPIPLLYFKLHFQLKLLKQTRGNQEERKISRAL